MSHRELFDLGSLGRDLTKLAWEDPTKRVYERVELLEQLAGLLAAGQNVVLVGKPGVGKNALVESLAWAAMASYLDSFEGLYGRPVWFPNRPAPCVRVPPELQGRRIIECAP